MYASRLADGLRRRACVYISLYTPRPRSRGPRAAPSGSGDIQHGSTSCSEQGLIAIQFSRAHSPRTMGPRSNPDFSTDGQKTTLIPLVEWLQRNLEEISLTNSDAASFRTLVAAARHPFSKGLLDRHLSPTCLRTHPSLAHLRARYLGHSGALVLRRQSSHRCAWRFLRR